MSEKTEIRTLAEVRADANRVTANRPVVPDPRTPGQSTRLNPGELEEIEEAARLGYFISPEEVLAMAETLRATARRIARRFNETAEARADAAAARERAERAERALEARGPASDEERLECELSWSRDRAEKAEKELTETRTRLRDAQIQIGDLRNQIDQAGALVPMQLLAEANQSLKARDRLLESATRDREESHQRVKALETEVKLLKVALGNWSRAGDVVTRLAFDPETVQALESVPTHIRSAVRLAEVVRGIRRAWLQFNRPAPTGTPLT